jgi:hypothetical protein
MKCLSKLFALLDLNDEPGCSKDLLRQIFRRNGKFTIPTGIMRTSTDSAPLVRHGLIERNKNGKVGLTSKAQKMID